MWFLYGLIGILLLYGIALLFGKCGGVADAINKLSGYDVPITKRGHFILKGLQSIGIAVFIALFLVNRQLGYEWAKYGSYAALAISAVGIYILETKLYVNTEDVEVKNFSNESPEKQD